jgi:hypothetical protein
MATTTHIFDPDPASPILLNAGTPWSQVFTYYLTSDNPFDTVTTEKVSFVTSLSGSTPLGSNVELFHGVNIIGDAVIESGGAPSVTLEAGGTPTVAGTYKFFIKGEGTLIIEGGSIAVPLQQTKEYTVTVSGLALAVTPSGGAIKTALDTDPVRGTPFISTPFTIANGTGSYKVELSGDWAGTGSGTNSIVRVGVNGSGVVPGTLSNNINIVSNTFYIVSPMDLAITAGTWTQNLKITDNQSGSVLNVLGYTFTATNGAASLTIIDPTDLPTSYTQLTNGSYSFTATGGSGTYTWSKSGTLPTGATLTTVGNSFVLTLTKPLNAGTFNSMITVSDGTLTASKTLTMVVANAIEIIDSLADGTAGTPYSSSLTLIGDSPYGTNSYTWTKSGNFPLGLTFPYPSGKVLNITNTPTTAGTYDFTVTCTSNDLGPGGGPAYVATKAVRIVIAAGTNPTLDVTGLPLDNTVSYTQGQLRDSIVLSASGTGLTLPLTWSYTMQSGTLPTGLALNTVGNTYVLSGTPTAYTPTSSPMISFRVEDGRAAPVGVGGITATLVVTPDLWLSSTPPAGVTGTAYNTTGTFSTAINGVDGSGYSLVSFSGLPDGLTCSLNTNTGILSITGTPTKIGNFNANIVINAPASGLGTTVQRTIHHLIAITGTAITITPTNTTLCTTAAVPVKVQAKVTGGATNKFSITPSAGTLSPSGPYDSDQIGITYTPDGTGVKTLTIISEDDNGVLKDVTVTVTTDASVCSVSPTTTTSLYEGQTVVVAATITNSCATVKGYWQAIGDSGAGRFSPSNQGASVTYVAPSSITSPKSVTLTFNPYEQADQSYNVYVTLLPGPVTGLGITTASPLPNGTVSSVYTPVTFARTATPSGTASWSLLSALPTGMILSSAGVLSGTPTEGGVFKVNTVVAVTPSAGGAVAYASKVLDLTVAGGTGISFTVSPTSGSVSGGTVVTLYDGGSNFLAGDKVLIQSDSSTGFELITPTSITATTITFTTPAWGYSPDTFLCNVGLVRLGTTIATKQRAWTWTQAGGNLAISNYTPQSVIAGQLTDLSITVTGTGFNGGCVVKFNQNNTGNVDLTTTYFSGNGSLLAVLPASYFTTGHANETATISVYRASDGSTVTSPALFRVSTALLQITTTQVELDAAPGSRGASYSKTLAVEGGVSPYSWSLNSGSEALPTGLSLSSVGQIFGTIDLAADSSTPTFKVTDNLGTVATKSLRIPIIDGALSITTNSLDDARNESSYSKQLVGSGGTPEYEWSITAGGLPDGLTLSSSGLISGTPADTPGATYTFTVHLVDSTTASVDKVLSIKLLEALSVSTITSITPSFGSIAGGTAVTVIGTNFISGCGIKFDGIAAIGLTYISATEIRCITPPGSAGFVTVDILNPDGGGGTKTNAFEYRTITAPIITSINRQDGPFEGGQTVILYGNNFTGISGVKFGLDPTAPGSAFDAVIVSSDLISSPQSLTLTTPAYLNTDRTAKVEVNIYATNASGVGTFASGDSGYTYRPAPVITQVLPNSGSTAGQNTVYVIGRNFFERGNSKPRVFIGNVEVPPANIVLREE